MIDDLEAAYQSYCEPDGNETELFVIEKEIYPQRLLYWKNNNKLFTDLLYQLQNQHPLYSIYRFIKDKFLSKIVLLITCPIDEMRRTIYEILSTISIHYPGMNELILKNMTHHLQEVNETNLTVIGVKEILVFYVNFQVETSCTITNNEILYNVVIPLYKSRHLPYFCHELHMLVAIYLEKNHCSTPNYLLNLFRIWPKDSKMGYFIEELGYVIETFNPHALIYISESIFEILKKCLVSLLIDLIHRTLMLLKHTNMKLLILFEKEKAIRILLPSILNLKETQNWRNTSKLILEILLYFNDVDPKIFNEIIKNSK